MEQIHFPLPHLPSLRQLQYFVTIMETQSFSRAALRCNVTQPTLSSGLRELETMLGQKLFERTSRGVTLTRAGVELTLPAQDILARAENFVDMARSNREPMTGGLTLGIIPTIAPYVLPHLLPALQDTYPDLDLQLKEDLTGRLLGALERREIDAVLMAFPFDTPGVEQMILWSEPFLLAAPGHGKIDPRPMAVADLPQHNVMLLEDGHCLRDHALAACHLQPAAQRKTFGATSLATLIQMVQHGYGVTLLPAMAIDPDHPPAGITLRRFSAPQPARQIGLAWRKGSARVKEFDMLGKFIVKTLTPG